LAILVTGGSGMIGSHVVMELIEDKREDKIVIYDIVPPKNPFVLKHIGNKVVYVDGNILDIGRLLETVEKYDVKGIIHTAAFISYKYVNSNPMLSYINNVNGMLNVLEIARINDLKVVYTSSGAVYGKVGEYAKEDFPIKPGDMYGMTKAAGELIGDQYANTYGLDYVATRLYFVYGPGLSLTVTSVEETFTPPVHPIKILYLFALKAVNKQPLKIDKGGDSKIDYTYVKDSAHGIVLAYYAKKPPHRAYNISTGRAYSLKEIAEIVNKYAGQELIKIGDGEVKGWPPRALYLDNTLASKELGYKPIYGMEKGLAEFCKIIEEGLK
jgi:nucleoside-diphosphate-sugar epimerase